MADAERLRLLQDSLVLLKQQYPHLKLRKGASKTPAQHPDSRATDSKAGTAADPFPIHLSVNIPAPLSASRYDIESLGIALQLSSSVLQLPTPPAGLAVRVSNAELPAKLKSVIAQQLHVAWAAAVAAAAASTLTSTQQDSRAGDQFGLGAVLRYAEQHFVQLITACPQFIESYEGVDSNGATQRRFTIISASDAVTDAEFAAAAAPAGDAGAAVRGTAAADLAPAAPAAAMPAEAPGAPAAMHHKAADAPAAASSLQGGQAPHSPETRLQQQSVTAPVSYYADGAQQQQQQQQQAPPPSSSTGLTPPPPVVPSSTNTSNTLKAVPQPQQGLSASEAPFQPPSGLIPAAGLAQPPAASAGGLGAGKPQQGPQQQQQQAVDAATAALQQLQFRGAPAQAPSAVTGFPGRGRGRGGDSVRGRGRGRGGGREGYTPPAAAAGGGGQQLSGQDLAARDLQAAHRRYGRSFRFQHTQQDPQHPEQQQQQQQFLAGAAGDALQQPGHSLPAAGPSQQQQLQPQQAVATIQQQHLPTTPQSFSILLRPTDPLWGASRGPLHITGTLNPVLYPGPGSLSLTVNPSRGVAAAETWVLQEALNRELQQEGGRVWQLRSVLRWCENYAGSELDKCFQAQQELFAGQRQGGEQQQQQQRRQGPSGARQRGARQGFAAGRGQQRSVSAATAAAASAAPAAASPDHGGIRVIRATHTKQQQQQQQAGQLTQQQQQGGEDTVLGLRLKPLVRNREDSGCSAAGGWLAAGGDAAHLHPYASATDGSSSSDGSSGSIDEDSSSRRSERSLDEHSSDSSSSSSGTESETGSDSDASGSDGPQDELQLHGGGEGSSSQGPGGWAVTLEGLKLDNVGVLEVVQAVLQLSCTRCSSSTTVLLTAAGGSLVSSTTAPAAEGQGTTGATPAAASSSSSGRSSRAFEWGGSCSTCQQELGVLLRPRFVHEGSNVLAGLKAVGCSPLDVLPSVYGATCADCDAVGALRGLQVGVPASRSCGHCHRPMGVSIPSISFTPQGPPTGGRKAAGRSGGLVSRRRKGPSGSRGGGALVEGSPLPDNGACKHYRHSYRWLRFPCCGARYPCDLCHEEATADGHDAAWATRMVCGFCSREQSLAPACKHCGKKLATSASKPSGRNTRHWEGGSGCRDSKMLDRRDAAKYRNSKAKTKSAKAKRVGPKPWSGGASGTRSA